MSILVSAPPQHLLIDGNNVGRAWPDLAKAWRRNPAVGQRLLVERVQGWHDVMGWRLTVVFDGRGAALSVEQPTEEATLVVAYSARGSTADTVIEQWVACSRDPSLCVVATGDRALAQTVQASGAGVIGPTELLAWLKRAEDCGRRRTDAWRQRAGEG